METEVLRDLGYSLLGLERQSEARGAFLELLDLATRDGLTPSLPLVDSLDGIALAADRKNAFDASRLRAGACRVRRTANLANSPRVTELESHFEKALIDGVGPDAWEREQAVGAALTLQATIDLARSLAAAATETTTTHASRQPAQQPPMSV